MNQSKIIGAVEIGASKVVALVGEIENRRHLNIIGFGQATSMGVRKGEIVDLRAASVSTHAALGAAESNAGAHIEGVYLSITGGHLDGFYNRGAVNVSSPDNTVTPEDMRRAVASAKQKELPPDRVYIHHIQNGFYLDDRHVENPLGMQGEKLEVSYWHVHGAEKKIRDHIHVINGINLHVEDIIISSVATGCMVTNETEKKQGVLVVDIGCGTTDYVLYRHGHILCTGVIPVGGDHMTNDLSLGLRIGVKHAENLKAKFAKAIIDKEDKGDMVWLTGDLSIGDRQISRQAIYQVTQARMEELFMILKNKLGSHLGEQNLPGGVVLTGGTSRLSCLPELARRVLGVEARLGENKSWVRPDLREPEYCTALGLLYYGLTAQSAAGEPEPALNVLQKVMRLFGHG